MIACHPLVLVALHFLGSTKCLVSKACFLSTTAICLGAKPITAILNEDGLHHTLNHAIPMLDDTNLEMQQVTNVNATVTAGMLLTGSSIGRSFEANNFTIVDHLEEEHKHRQKMTIRQSEEANFGVCKKCRKRA